MVGHWEGTLGNKSNQTLYQKEERSGEVKKLKGIIRSQEHEIKRLKSELRTYEAAFKKNITFLKTKTKQYNLEELIDGAKMEMTLEEIGESKQEKFEDMKEKWLCHKCQVGLMKFISIPKGDDVYYFRKCSMSNCQNRTETKLLTEEVDKGV